MGERRRAESGLTVFLAGLATLGVVWAVYGFFDVMGVAR